MPFPQDISFNISHIVIKPRSDVLRVRVPECFNISHIVINQCSSNICFCTCKVSIYPILLLNKAAERMSELYGRFQYIPYCY